jgi:hypothetical protein
MSAERRSVVPAVVLVLLVLVGAGVRGWRARRRASARAPEAELERRRVAAMDPAFDPAKPAGGIAGVVRTSDGKPAAGAVVAIVRNRGKDELPSFNAPIPRVAITDGDGRFLLADVIPGEYGVTATSLQGSPARQEVAVASQKTAEVVLTLGSGGALLTGQVHDVGGGPVAAARAIVRSMEMFGGPAKGQASVFQVSADDGGVFKVRLAAGNYDITVRAGGYAQARERLVFSVAQTRTYRLNPAARLAGRVVDRASHEPVPGASVWLRLDRLDSYVDRSATSDEEGRFSFDDLSAGGYVVMAREAARVGLAKAVTVGIAQAVTDVEVPVERGRAIRGNVVDAQGKALEGIRVVASRIDPPFERPIFVKSDAKGAFAAEGLLPAKYRVNAWDDGKGAAKAATATVTSRDVEGIRLQLAAQQVVRGQVVDSSGQPVGGASVTGTVETRIAEARFSVDRGTTDVEGKFELNRLQPGKLTLSAHHPDRGNAKWGPGELGGQPTPVVTLKLEAGASVAGVVTFENGTPAPRVIVWAGQQTNGPMFEPPAQAPTDEAGRFVLKGLGKGKYLVMARKENSLGSGNPASRQDVTLAPGEQKSGLALVVPDSGKSIAGKVVAADGKPVSAAVVAVGLERAGIAFRMPQREGYPSTPHAVTDGDGAFAVSDLEEGRYTVWASDATSADAELAGVAAGSTSVVIKLPAGASAAGVVHTREGAPVTDYTIAALPGGAPSASPDDRMRLQVTARMWSPSVQVHDPAGAFFLGRLSPGSYQLNVTTADGQGGLLPVEIAAGEKKEGLTVVIDAGVKLTGRVLELDSGAPLEGVNVYVTSATSRLSANSGADGSFTLTGLAPGRARAEFQLGNGLTHVGEHVDLDVKPGSGTLDVGTIRMMKGNFDDRAGDFASRGRVGFTVSLVDGKAAVTGVRPGFPGEQAGLKQGDLVLAVGGRPTDGLGNGALDYLASGKLDQPLSVTVQSPGGSPREVTINRVSMDFDPARPTARPAGAQASRN